MTLVYQGPAETQAPAQLRKATGSGEHNWEGHVDATPRTTAG